MNSKSSSHYLLDPEHTDPARLKKEREKARKLRGTSWWKERLAKGECHYCGKKFGATQLTMDHVIPLARGGESTKGNIVPACKPCNQAKQLETPVEAIFRQLEEERLRQQGQSTTSVDKSSSDIETDPESEDQ